MHNFFKIIKKQKGLRLQVGAKYYFEILKKTETVCYQKNKAFIRLILSMIIVERDLSAVSKEKTNDIIGKALDILVF